MRKADPERGFLFHHGTLALSFAGTLGRRDDTQPVERIDAPERLGAWFRESGVLSKAPAVSRGELAAAVRLREAIYAAARTIRDGGAPAPRDLATINGAAARPPVDVRIARDGTAVQRTGRPPVDAALSTIARDAIDLLGDDRREALRLCELAGCGSLFLDDSRGKRRRWCSMERCGNRAKVAAFRERSR